VESPAFMLAIAGVSVDCLLVEKVTGCAMQSLFCVRAEVPRPLSLTWS
jgi:hypothetical protein